MKLPVIYEDDQLLVVNKPAGITVNRSDTTSKEETLQDLVERHLKLMGQKFQRSQMGQREEGEWETPQEAFINRSGIVHRLDKETSGVILVAKTLDAFIDLQKQFKERVVQKTYQALAHGKITPEEGEINVPVGRLPFNRMRFGVVAGGREAVTKYKVISNFKLQITNSKSEDLTLVELYPKTGRTHQIRVHLKYINHPIFADELYAGRKTAREDRKMLPRVFLHAHHIEFVHPKFGSSVAFDAPLPEELEELLSTLQTSS